MPDRQRIGCGKLGKGSQPVFALSVSGVAHTSTRRAGPLVRVTASIPSNVSATGTMSPAFPETTRNATGKGPRHAMTMMPSLVVGFDAFNTDAVVVEPPIDHSSGPPLNTTENTLWCVPGRNSVGCPRDAGLGEKPFCGPMGIEMEDEPGLL